MIFVDSSAWFTVFSRRDVNHAAAMSAIRSFEEQLVTSDYVVDETLTLLQARGEHRRAVAFGRRVIDGQWAKIVRIDDVDFSTSWSIFQTFAEMTMGSERFFENRSDPIVFCDPFVFPPIRHVPFGRFLSAFPFDFCSRFADCCFLLLSLSFLPPLSPISSFFLNRQSSSE